MKPDIRPIVLWSLVVIILGTVTASRQDPETVQPEDWREDVYEGDRSSHWPTVRAIFVKSHPTCAACGTSYGLNVHHIEPFHTNPELELDPDNLITLCRDHHFVLGHLRNWKKSNPNVVEDSKKLRIKDARQRN